MKKIMSCLLMILLIVIGVTSCGTSGEGSSQVTESAQPVKHNLYLDIDYEENLFFSKYNINILIGGQKIGSVENGKHFTGLFEASEGGYTIVFQKENDTTVKGSKTFKVVADTTFSCVIKAKRDTIEISGVEVVDSIENTSLVVEDVVGKNLKYAVDLLKETGFVNVNYEAEGNSQIFDTSNWVVVSQNLQAGQTVDKNEKIALVCIKTESYLNNNLKGLSITEAIKKASELGYEKIDYQDSENYSDISNTINNLTESELQEILVEEAKDASFDEKKLVLYVHYVAKTEVPNIIGMSLDQGARAMKAAGFSEMKYKTKENVTISDYENWIITEQNVSPGTKVPPTTEIIVFCVRKEIETQQPETTTTEEGSIDNSEDSTEDGGSESETTDNDTSSSETAEPTTEQIIGNLTIENCPDLKEIMETKEPKEEQLKAFSDKYRLKNLEFDGCVLSKSSEFGVRIGYGNYVDSWPAIGPEMNTYDPLMDQSYVYDKVNLSDFHEGDNVHVVISIKPYRDNVPIYYIVLKEMSHR